MIHFLPNAPGAAELKVLRSMFEARKRVFIDLLHWDLPVIAGRFELDEFDMEPAIYVVLSGEDGGHRASARLLPTTGPHILAGLFAELCDEEIPRGPTTLEITRFCLERRSSAALRRRDRDELIHALVTFALRAGIERFTGVAEVAWVRQVLSFGWRCRPLGAPREIGNRMLSAVSIEIDEDTPALLERCGLLPRPPAGRHTMSCAELGAAAIAEALLANGFCVVTSAMPPGKVEAIDRDLAPSFGNTPFCTGHFYGNCTRRFGRLLLRSVHAEAFVRHEAILRAAEHILAPACDTVQLNLTQGIAIHPGEVAQLPHRDQDMWRLGPGAAECLVNVIWPFTPFTRQNGATRIWPRSHGPAAREDPPDGEGLPIEMEPGDALVFLGSALHGAGANTSGDVRRGMIAGYCLGWLKPYENQWLAYPPAIARRFSPELAALVGYRQHRPNLGNHEGLCPSVLLRKGPPRNCGASDALLPAQAAAVAEHAASQRGSR